MIKQLTRVLLRRLIPTAAVFMFALFTQAYAASIPTTPGWYQIPNTVLRNVCPPNGFGGSSYGFTDNCRYVVEAWNSAIFDTRRNRLIVWGGGHADYLGNEIYAVNLSTLSVARLTDPALPVVTTPCPDVTEAIGSQANSRHTYDGIAYMENVDRMFVFGGGLASCGYLGRGTWTFDFASSTWQQMNPAGTIPRADPGIVTAYDPNAGKVFLHDLAYLYSYNFSTNSYQRLSGYNSIDYHMTAVTDPVRSKFVMVGAGNVYIYDISSGSSYTRQTLNTASGNAIVNSIYPGLAYDPTIDRIVAWNGGDSVYSLNLDSGIWSATTYSGGPGTAPKNGTFERWSYAPALNAFVVVNSMLTNAYTFRLSPGGSSSSAPATPTSLVVQ